MNGSTSIHGAKAIKIKRERAGTNTTWTSIDIRGGDKKNEVHTISIHNADSHNPATITGPGDDQELRTALAALVTECTAMHREYCPRCKANCPTTHAIDAARDILARE